MSQASVPDSTRRKQTTLKDIAEVVGVSINAVSSVLNPRKVPARVSPATRELILETARKLDYRRNATSRRICSKRTSTLGILVEDLTNSFSTSIVNGFDVEANRLGYLCFVGFSNPGMEDRYQQIKRYVDRGMDGMMIVGSPYDRDMEAVIRFATSSALPIIFTNHRVGCLSAPLVGGDHFQGGYLLGKRLIEENHRKLIQLVRSGEVESPFMVQRIEGLRSALTDRGLSARNLQLLALFDGEEITESVFKRFPGDFIPTALLAPNDYDAYQLIIGLKTQGICVPEDVAVVGYDIDKNCQSDPISLINNPLLASVFPLTSIRQPSAEYGRQAARVLIDIINNKPDHHEGDMILGVERVLGKSSRFPQSPMRFEEFVRRTIAPKATPGVPVAVDA